MPNTTPVHRLLLVSMLVFAAACSSDSTAQSLVMRNAFPGLSFDRPVDLQHAGDGSDRLFVVEQAGVIRVVQRSGGAWTSRVFLDISHRVASGGEMGLLGLTFDPDYRTNKHFYVNYTARSPLRTVIARYRATGNPFMADAATEKLILTFAQPFENHNGGQIAFGPDSNLYIATGDGGSGGDPQNHGQRLNTLLGKILRIDVRDTTADWPYVIPSDNPFANGQGGARPEIYAFGLRNPWRMSFDPVTGWLWAGDVGQNAWEEIDIIEKGKNYGWKTMEGKHCFSPRTNCDTAGLTMPIWEYARDLGVSVTGGHVYRGGRLPSLVGEYVYADFASGTIWGLRYDGTGAPVNRTIINSNTTVSSFGVDLSNELYILSFDGTIYTFDAESGVDGEDEVASDISRVVSEPNPFSATTSIRYTLARASSVRVVVHDVLGSIVATLVDETQSAGEHIALLDGSALAAGTYYFTIESGNGAVERGNVVLTK